MASGKKNYFRHSFFARNDIKLRLLRDKIGVGFYFYYFSLLEQCGEYSSDILSDDYEFHDSIIRNLWGVNLKKSERVANELHAVGLLFFEKREKTFYFKIDNLAKYLGKYQNKNETNTPNKRKENKIKENKIKINKKENQITDQPPQKKLLNLVIDSWNKIAGENNLIPVNILRLSSTMLRDFSESCNVLKNLDDWKKALDKIGESSYLLGKENHNPITFSWFVNYDNLAKVLEDKYKTKAKEEIEYVKWSEY